MRANIFLVAIPVLISALSGYGFYAANAGEDFCLLLSIGSGLSFAITLSAAIGIKTNAGRGTVNFKIVSAIIFILLLISHLIFGFTAVRPAPYVIINGILILIYAIIEYGIVKSDS